MRIEPFELEWYFAKHEFTVPYVLSASDCEGILQRDLLEMMDEETARLWKELKLGYTETRGLDLLRQEVAKLYDGISADDVLIVVPEEGVFLTLNSILSPGDHVICTYPGYQSLYAVPRAIGCRVDLWQPAEADEWRFDIGFLESCVCDDTRLIVVNFPHNPTGALPPKELYRRVIALAKERGIYVFSDEMYRFLEHEVEDRLPSGCEMYDRTVTLFGMSKVFGMAGARVGWLVTRDQNLYKELLALRLYTTICSSAPSEVLALAALRAKERLLCKHQKLVRDNRELLETFFADHAELFKWNRPRGGTIAFPRLLIDEPSNRFCEAAIKDAGVMLLPSTVFGFGDRHFRVGYGRNNVPEVLERLGAHLRKKYC